jgi:hypothetical protein
MVIYLQVSLCLDFQIEASMADQQLQHMLEKSQFHRAVAPSAPIQIQFHLNLCFLSVSLNRCYPLAHKIILNSFKNKLFSAGVPTLTRIQSSSPGSELRSRTMIPFSKSRRQTWEACGQRKSKKFA